MKKISKIVSAMLCTVLAAGMLSGCGEVDKEGYVAKTRSEADNVSSQAEVSQAEVSQAEQSSVAEKITSDGAWKSMAFNVDGTDFVLDRLTLSEIEDAGWSFDPAVYGMQDLSADPLVFYQRSVCMNHEGYDENSFIVGFTNFGDEACGLDTINVWTVEFTSKDVAGYPAVTLEGGITWGADEAALKAAYGEPSAAEKFDGYTHYTYTDNAANVVYLDVYDDGGLGRIVMESYD
ncbi:MAG: hypothetical protein MR503_06335 [Oscillospiraceae bacterium]|nr:hypothetical protein [Oscillospiraceae bacterium]